MAPITAPTARTTTDTTKRESEMTKDLLAAANLWATKNRPYYGGTMTKEQQLMIGGTPWFEEADVEVRVTFRAGRPVYVASLGGRTSTECETLEEALRNLAGGFTLSMIARNQVL
jgi:hypothetical protein